MEKKKLTEKKKEEAMDWLNVIWVTAIGDCPKKIQFRQFYKAQRDPKTYEQYQGNAVHLLFDKISKLSSLNRKENYKSVLRSQIEIPIDYVPRLYRNLPFYEERIKTFFAKHRIGKASFGSCFTLEESLKAPLKDLDFDLDLPEEIVEKYSLSGKLDFLTGTRLLEIKSGSKVRGKDFRQAIVYRELAKYAGKPVGYFLIYLGKDGPIVKKASLRHWDFSRNQNKLVEEIQDLLIQTIQDREKLREDPYYPFKEWKPKSDECRFCNYRTSCRSRITKMKHFLERNIWRKA